MISKLVSIITPCYNTGNIIHRLFESILEQDYPYIEMYAIDDGSTDNTSEVIKSYIPKFKEKGYKLTYVYQENSGQSVAINNGLKMIKGEFFVWPDSDDFYSTHSALSKMVRVLEMSDDTISMVRCLAEFIDEESLQKTRAYSPTTKNDLFEDCLFIRHPFWFCSGGYMVKVKLLDKAIANRDIYTEKDAGQNWQLLLPLLYNKKCITINEYHYKILDRSLSHSRGHYKSYDEKTRQIQSYENTLVATLERMTLLSDVLKIKYIEDVRIKYLLEQYDNSWNFHKKETAIIIQRKLKRMYQVRIPVFVRLKKRLYWMYKDIISHFVM